MEAGCCQLAAKRMTMKQGTIQMRSPQPAEIRVSTMASRYSASARTRMRKATERTMQKVRSQEGMEERERKKKAMERMTSRER